MQGLMTVAQQASAKIRLHPALQLHMFCHILYTLTSPPDVLSLKPAAATCRVTSWRPPLRIIAKC